MANIRSNPPFSAELIQNVSRQSAAGSAAAAQVSLPSSAFSTLPAANFAIDVGTNPLPPKILRNGIEITAPGLNPAQVGDFINHANPLPRPQVQVVISQSLPAGAKVAKGTPVDLVLTVVNDIPFNIFTNFHPDFASYTVGAVLPVVTDPQVAPLLGRDPSTLSESDRGVIATSLQHNGINVNLGSNFNLAFQTLQNAQAFQ